MEEPPASLSQARVDSDAAAARLRRLKRSVGEPRGVSPRPERWRVVRRMIESLREVFSGWAAFREDEDASPESRRARRELEARALRAESALAELEAREKAIDEDRGRALAELERVQEGWRLLRQASAPRGEFADERTTSAILGRLQTLLVESERALSEERAAQREATQADQAWRWIVSVAFPTFEQRMTDADATLTLPTMRRLVKDLDRRWRAAHQAWKSQIGFPAALDQLQAAQLSVEATQRQADQRIEDQRRAGVQELEVAKTAWRLEAEGLRTRLGDRIKELESALGALEGVVEPLRRESTAAQQLSAASRAQLDNLAQRAQSDAAKIEQLQASLNLATQQAQQLSAALAAAGSRPAAIAAPPAAVPAAGPAGPAGPAEPPIPSIEPALEPGWQRVLDRLRQPLETATAQLRRLFAAPMPEGHRALIRLSAGSLAQAADIVKGVREFLDEGSTPLASGRLEAAVDAALTSWEPALARRGITVARVIGRGLPSVSARGESLRMAAYHLIRNAYEAMPSGGSLTVKVWRDEASGEARASFADTGPGLGADPSSLFSPFLSSKPGHLGLGLALARRVARRGGGELEAGPSSQRGALLTLRLPPETPDAPALG